MLPTPRSDDDLVDEASEGSFPASDPPSFWAGADTRHREAQEIAESHYDTASPRGAIEER